MVCFTCHVADVPADQLIHRIQGYIGHIPWSIHRLASFKEINYNPAGPYISLAVRPHSTSNAPGCDTISDPPGCVSLPGPVGDANSSSLPLGVYRDATCAH